MPFERIIDLSLYFVADPYACAGHDIVEVVRGAIRGGVTCVQLRNKHDEIGVVREQALAIQKILADSAIPFLINDHVELAVEIGADGVHIGQGDMNPVQARQMIGDDKILGLTAFTWKHYATIDPNIVDYVGTGPVFPTKTDKGKPVLDVDGFRDLIAYAPVPVVGIGGIDADNILDVISAGAKGVAMMRSISEAQSPYQSALQLSEKLNIAR